MTSMVGVPPQSNKPSGLAKDVSFALFSPKTFDLMEQVLEEAGVQEPDVSLLSTATHFLAAGERSADQYLQDIGKAYGLDAAVARRIAGAVVLQVLVAFKGVLSVPVEEMARAWNVDVVAGDGKSVAQRPAGKTQEIEAEQIDKELDELKEKHREVLEARDPLDIPGMVKEICENPAFQFQDASLQERCAKLIESRIRDVRTPEQTRAQLEKAVEKGGLGVTGRRLADMLALIEGRVSAFQGNLSQQEQQKRIDQRAGLPDKTQLAKNEETLLTKRYVELTGKVPPAHIAPAAPSVSRTSVAISAHHEQIAREGKIDAAKVKEAVEGAKQTAVPPRPKSTPSMQEVTFEKRLSGPIDELRSLTLTDFRRLSKDPLQAATKVKDKVDLMEEQGYDKLVEAVQAWRGSTLNQMYVSLTREAVLTGTSVSELLSRKRIAGEETLSDEELKAIMKLNAELRF